MAREEGGSKRFWLSGVTMGQAWRQALEAPADPSAPGSADALERLCTSLGCTTVRAFVLVHTYVEAQDSIETASHVDAGLVGAAATLDRRLDEEAAARTASSKEQLSQQNAGAIRATVPLGTGWAGDGLDEAGGSEEGTPDERRSPKVTASSTIEGALDDAMAASASADGPAGDQAGGSQFEYEYRWVVARRVRVSARTEVPPAVLLGLAARDEERRSRRGTQSSPLRGDAREGGPVADSVSGAAGAGDDYSRYSHGLRRGTKVSSAHQAADRVLRSAHAMSMGAGASDWWIEDQDDAEADGGSGGLDAESEFGPGAGWSGSRPWGPSRGHLYVWREHTYRQLQGRRRRAASLPGEEPGAWSDWHPAWLDPASERE